MQMDLDPTCIEAANPWIAGGFKSAIHSER
jgi:hypothetical protein